MAQFWVFKILKNPALFYIYNLNSFRIFLIAIQVMAAYN